MTVEHAGSLLLALTVWLASILFFLRAGAKFERAALGEGWTLLLFAVLMQGVAFGVALI